MYFNSYHVAEEAWALGIGVGAGLRQRALAGQRQGRGRGRGASPCLKNMRRLLRFNIGAKLGKLVPASIEHSSSDGMGGRATPSLAPSSLHKIIGREERYSELFFGPHPEVKSQVVW